MSEQITQNTPPVKVLLLGLDMGQFDAERSMDELAALCEANNMEAVASLIQKKDAPLMHETFDRHRRELQASIDADPTGEGFIKDMFLCELENHEYSYTGTAEDTLGSLGLSFEDVAADPRLAHGLDLAEQEILEQQQTMGM